MAANQAAISTSCKKLEAKSVPACSGTVPLIMVTPGTEVVVQAIRGKDEIRRFLESLGFVENATVTVVTELGGNMIVNIKNTRVAISKAMAARIYTN